MEKKHIVINGFSADAIAVLVNSFNSLSKRGRVISTKHISPAERRAGKACINDSAISLLDDICKIIGSAPWKSLNAIDFDPSLPIEKRIYAQPHELVVKYNYKQDKAGYENAISEICSMFNKKMKIYGVASRLLYTKAK